MRLYNSLSQTIEEFIPSEKGDVKMYVCGITPYDTTHLGHAFVNIFFDVLRRYLEYKENRVTYVQNVTDIDNDILKRAKETNTDWIELGNIWTNKYLTDLQNLNIKMPDHYVKATESIETMIIMIKELIKKGFAYEKAGTVYYDTKKFIRYGKLSSYSEDQMIKIASERGGNPTDKRKKNSLDFVLWQKSLANEPYWESPWGRGRPGWHIECSSMIKKYLGDQIDIHGGGRDLIFPHHESEIAQSESYTGKLPFVRFWLHTSMVMYKGEKMSKSLGNLIMVSDLIKKYSANTIRWLLLSNHYRKPWEFNEGDLITAEKKSVSLNKLKHINYYKEDIKLISQFGSIMDVDMDSPNALQLLADNLASDDDSRVNACKKIASVMGFRI